MVGAGHAGLAMSGALTRRSIDHVVLERGSVAHSWKTERWDSLRLLTPNSQTRLPGATYDGDEPDGFMAVADVIAFVERYAETVDAPVLGDTTVTSVRAAGDGYDILTGQGRWHARAVVLAGGACNVPTVPDYATALPSTIESVTPDRYKNPDQLADGGVLVVGASATGLQLAEEIHRSGRPVTVSVGEHVRMPRVYRDEDIFTWMARVGLLDERWDEVDDVVRARNVPSPQLIGTPERRSLDLDALTSIGVQLRGRLGTIRDGVAMFSGGLRNQCALADLKLNRLLDTIDERAGEAGYGEPDGPERCQPTTVGDPPLTLDLASGEIRTIVWATGFRADHSWLDVPVVDHKGRVRHDGGIVSDAPGMYLLGATFLRRRKSSFIHGAGDDAEDLAAHLAAHLATR
ncbi:MAG: NAD(P)-binding domain-containing protein [Acidimicrobiia bacterium]|nr:NAD(P)-binding domain-containing protein [Acidimicrobiia bacterium]